MGNRDHDNPPVKGNKSISITANMDYFISFFPSSPDHKSNCDICVSLPVSSTNVCSTREMAITHAGIYWPF